MLVLKELINEEGGICIGLIWGKKKKKKCSLAESERDLGNGISEGKPVLDQSCHAVEGASCWRLVKL